MNEKFQSIDDLIAAFLADKLSDQERRELNEWINLSEDNKKYFQSYQQIWFSCVDENSLKRFDDEKAFEKFMQRVNTAERYSERPKIRVIKYWNVLKYAAVILAMFLISYVSYYKGEDNLKQALTQITIESPIGSQTRLYLPDSTLVVLNAKSVLSYPQDFGVYSRSVKLSGEGYFEVTQNTKKPFTIHGNDVEVTVLGTEFNFKDYPDVDEISVSLFKGSVKLDNRLAEQEMILKPNEQMVMSRNDGSMKKITGISPRVVSWTKGELIFRDSTLEEVIQLLEKNYNVTICVVNDSLNQYLFNGRFTVSEMTAEKILKALSTTGRMNFIKENNKITIY